METSDLLSVKVSKSDKSVETVVSYFVHGIDRNRDETIKNIPHPDLYKALNELSSYLAIIYHCAEDEDDNYQATGFKWNTDKEIILTGKVKTLNNKVRGISTPVINITKDVFEFEDDLNNHVIAFSKEVIALLLNQKEAVTQMTIDDAAKDNEKDDKADSSPSASSFESGLADKK